MYSRCTIVNVICAIIHLFSIINNFKCSKVENSEKINIKDIPKAHRF